MSRSCALATGCQDLPWPLWPVSAHTSAFQPHVRHRVPLLRPSAVGATAACGTSAPLSNSTRDWSIPPPSQACTVATPWQSHSRGGYWFGETPSGRLVDAMRDPPEWQVGWRWVPCKSSIAILLFLPVLCCGV